MPTFLNSRLTYGTLLRNGTPLSVRPSERLLIPPSRTVPPSGTLTVAVGRRGGWRALDGCGCFGRYVPEAASADVEWAADLEERYAALEANGSFEGASARMGGTEGGRGAQAELLLGPGR